MPTPFDMMMEQSTTTGTGVYTLAGAVLGHQSFAGVGNGGQVYYTARDVDVLGNPTGGWETGVGTYATSGTTLTRSQVLASSNAGAAVNWSAGTRRVFVTVPATFYSYPNFLQVVAGAAGAIEASAKLQVRRAGAGVAVATTFTPGLLVTTATASPQLASFLNTGFSLNVADGLTFEQNSTGFTTIRNGMGPLGTGNLGQRFEMAFPYYYMRLYPANNSGYFHVGVSNVPSEGTELHQTPGILAARIDSITNYYNPVLRFAATDGTTTWSTFGFLNEGTRVGGVFTVNRLALWDFATAESNPTVFYYESGDRIFRFDTQVRLLHRGPTFSSTSANNDYALWLETSLTKNDSDTQTFNLLLLRPNINAGASNLNTTLNVLAINPLATATTGVTTYLINAQYNSSTRLTLLSDGALTHSNGVASFAASASLLVPTSAGYAPVLDGSLGYDTTQDAWSAGGAGGLNGKIGRVFDVRLSTTDTLSAATGTTEQAFSWTWNLPANFLIAKKTLRVRMFFQFSSSATSIPTGTFRIKVGGTIVFATPPAAFSASQTNVGFGIEVDISGTAAVGASVNTETGPLSGIFSNINSHNAIPQPVALATNTLMAVTASVQYSSTTAGNTVTLRRVIISEIF